MAAVTHGGGGLALEGEAMEGRRPGERLVWEKEEDEEERLEEEVKKGVDDGAENLKLQPPGGGVLPKMQKAEKDQFEALDKKLFDIFLDLEERQVQ